VKCPHCQAWTLVTDTRGTRRRRKCGNEHTFWTEEQVIPPRQRGGDHRSAAFRAQQAAR